MDHNMIQKQEPFIGAAFTVASIKIRVIARSIEYTLIPTHVKKRSKVKQRQNDYIQSRIKR